MAKASNRPIAWWFPVIGSIFFLLVFILGFKYQAETFRCRCGDTKWVGIESVLSIPLRRSEEREEAPAPPGHEHVWVGDSFEQRGVFGILGKKHTWEVKGVLSIYHPIWPVPTQKASPELSPTPTAGP